MGADELANMLKETRISIFTTPEQAVIKIELKDGSGEFVVLTLDKQKSFTLETGKQVR